VVFAAIDPGLTATGYAVFDTGVLVMAGIVRTSPKAALEDRIRKIHLALYDLPADRLVERMVVRGGRNKGNPQILCDLNLLAGALGNDWVVPHQWKGMLPKEVHQPRILATLSPGEKALVEAIKPASLRHNAVDAVGIGLYRLGRLTPATRKINRRSK
jgi:hypothetical protein